MCFRCMGITLPVISNQDDQCDGLGNTIVIHDMKVNISIMILRLETKTF